MKYKLTRDGGPNEDDVIYDLEVQYVIMGRYYRQRRDQPEEYPEIDIRRITHGGVPFDNLTEQEICDIEDAIHEMLAVSRGEE